MSKRLLCSAAALPFMLAAPAAWAEEADSAPLTDTIVVTGSRQDRSSANAYFSSSGPPALGVPRVGRNAKS